MNQYWNCNSNENSDSDSGFNIVLDAGELLPALNFRPCGVALQCLLGQRHLPCHRNLTILPGLLGNGHLHQLFILNLISSPLLLKFSCMFS